MATVTINGNNYDSYSSLADADDYLAASVNFATWGALSDDQKGRFLVSASRFLDSLPWRSACLPLTDTGNTQTATILIAEQLALGNTAILALEPYSDATKRLKAGSAEIEYQSRPWFVKIGQKYANIPEQIFGLIKDCLTTGTSAAAIGAKTFGTDGKGGASAYNGGYELLDV